MKKKNEYNDSRLDLQLHGSHEYTAIQTAGQLNIFRTYMQLHKFCKTHTKINPRLKTYVIKYPSKVMYIDLSCINTGM